MAKDDETGVDPVAQDGDVDDVERARRKRHAKGGGSSIAERAASGELDGSEGDAEEGDGQFAMGLIEATLPPTLARLIPRGMPVEVTVSMGTGAVQGKGLFGPDEDVILVTRFRVRKYEPVPKREDDKTTRFEIRQHLTPLYSARAGTDQARAMIGEAEAEAAAAARSAQAG